MRESVGAIGITRATLENELVVPGAPHGPHEERSAREVEGSISQIRGEHGFCRRIAIERSLCLPLQLDPEPPEEPRCVDLEEPDVETQLLVGESRVGAWAHGAIRLNASEAQSTEQGEPIPEAES